MGLWFKGLRLRLQGRLRVSGSGLQLRVLGTSFNGSGSIPSSWCKVPSTELVLGGVVCWGFQVEGSGFGVKVSGLQILGNGAQDSIDVF